MVMKFEHAFYISHVIFHHFQVSLSTDNNRRLSRALIRSMSNPLVKSHYVRKNVQRKREKHDGGEKRRTKVTLQNMKKTRHDADTNSSR